MATDQESRWGRFYRLTYERVCGRHPRLLPWHFQWLATFYLIDRLRRLLPEMSGDVLDVGCGDMPYRAWCTRASSYVGLDIVVGGNADIVVAPNATWPFPDQSFDGVFATQVIEHVEDLQHTLAEIARVCRAGGTITLSCPFLYNEHGSPWDFQRFTGNGLARLLPYPVKSLENQGGVGSTIAILLLNWLDESLNANKPLRLFKAMTLPLWIPLCLLVNMLAICVDRMDRTEKFYSSAVVVFSKPG